MLKGQRCSNFNLPVDQWLSLASAFGPLDVCAFCTAINIDSFLNLIVLVTRGMLVLHNLIMEARSQLYLGLSIRPTAVFTQNMHISTTSYWRLFSNLLAACLAW